MFPKEYETQVIPWTPVLPQALPPGFEQAGIPDDELKAGLERFQPIQLDAMESVALLKRVEVKYVMPAGMLPFILDALYDRYAVLEVAGQRLNRYRTLYFDTADFAMYRRHHAGAADRYKVRSRTYVDSDSSFLEVKHKTNRKRVIKSRIPTSEQINLLRGEAAGFVNDACPYDPNRMQPTLGNSYRRITLADTVRQERVTLDVDLRFDGAGRSVSLPHIVIAEVKQERFSQASEFIRLMHQYHVRRNGFSKYCMGASMVYPELKQNRFKKKHRLLARLAEWQPTERIGHELY
ncbi:MAG: polyphosphate polymerase domain-containing protein [Caldilineaceae bacterium]|nr:polyphosphate polymerase domain-containing protein [Caldilineaceae bacterium]